MSPVAASVDAPNRDEDAAASRAEWLDTSLTARLRKALRSPESAVTVNLRGPVAVLRGRVANDSQRHLAEKFVGLEPGVSQVVNQLVVGGSNHQ
ncbi:MAG: BON domain-containing protein [Thermoguttaceae bacterium]|nr:BON domain-containing protein [Thermoguttaceae bacterium]